MDKLILGMSVEIMRSDGRVHGAIITSIREDNRGVSVEWYEKGETKGKEIDINALIKSNPKLFPTSNIPVPSVQTTKTNEIDKISIGMNVKIQRSNGRIQEAMITKINRETSCIAVEWFEMGETKGKDVDLKSLMRNNPDLFCPNIPMPDPSLTKKKNTQPGSQTSRQSIAVPQPQTSGSQTSRNSSILNPATQQKQPELSIMDTTHSLDDLFDVEEEIKPIRRKTYDTRPAYSSKKVAISKLQNIFEEDIVAQEFNDIKENEPIIEPPPVMNKSRKSKSQLLNNIEELERNRELRRTQQGEVRKKREIQMQIDPGNPNWEFLSMIRDYQATIDYRPLRFNDPIVDNRICVCVRKRPFGKKEIANKEVEVVTVPSKDHVIVHQPQVKVDLTKYLVNQKFRFDYAFNEGASNELVYKFTAQPLVRTIFQRGFATCFAYGQTGSGKTHTMGGVIEGKHQDCSNGVYAMTANDVFVLLHSPEYRNEHLSVSCSFFEIYGTKVFDLLSKKATLRILEDGKHLVQVVGLREVKVHNVSEVLKLIKIGSDQRTAGQTSANSNSSRSHAVFQIILRKREKNTDLLYGKFSLIDLAGNERGADTISSDRQTRLEGGEINKSLLALKECIRAMGREEQHVPFRGSKLTLILRDSFVGKNAKTCMIAMISPGITCVENTMNTLRYADRVKELGSDLEQPEENGIAPSTSNK